MIYTIDKYNRLKQGVFVNFLYTPYFLQVKINKEGE